MKIALLGYGKMGREIESLSATIGHEIVLRIDGENSHEFTKETASIADVAIEFTRPDQVVKNLNSCIDFGIPVVTGTTGWYDQLPGIKESCLKKKGSILYASNFSIGVQVFFQINKTLAAIMNKLPDYDVEIEEIHHLEKIDKPSGTALSIADILLKNISRKTTWTLDKSTEPETQRELFIAAERKPHVVGKHSVTYQSKTDTISLIHNAKSRAGFANGAILAANWLKDKRGFFTIDDFITDIFFTSQNEI